MITITPDNQIDRDGEVIGSIIGETAWMKAKQAPRIVGQIRQAAGINGLKFEVAETPAEIKAVEIVSALAKDGAFDAPTSKDSSQVEQISAVEVVDTLDGSEPPASCDDLAGGISFAIGSDWGTPGTQYFARCFINNHGSDAYSAYCKANGI